MNIRTFIGVSTGALETAVEMAETIAQSLLGRLSSAELFSVQAQSISDQNGYTHIITVVYA